MLIGDLQFLYTSVIKPKLFQSFDKLTILSLNKLPAKSWMV